ncbi:MAG: TlpA family protein disulfide reductase [Myxococcales bacterium FL481]|nr:MAG: TlpA family protein disulfide reductase [Myxococcales bacterium FL481]
MTIAQAMLAASLLGLLGPVACATTGATGAASNRSGLAPGDMAPSIAVAGQAGPDVTSFAGKVLVVDFWASWCEPCKDELPELEQLYTKLNPSGLEIVGVSVDEDRRDMDRFLEGIPLSFALVFDATHEIAQRWNPPAMPTSYVVDPEGTIVHVQRGFRPGDQAILEQKIREHLPETTP